MDPTNIEVKDFDELEERLYELAVRYRDSFDGLAASYDGGASIFVEVKDRGVSKTFNFTNPNPLSMASFVAEMEGRGYLNGRMILHELVIRRRNECREQIKLALAKEKRERRWRHIDIATRWIVPILAAIFSSFLCWYLSYVYIARPANDKLYALEKEVAKMRDSQQLNPAVYPSVHPSASSPAHRQHSPKPEQ